MDNRGRVLKTEPSRRVIVYQEWKLVEIRSQVDNELLDTYTVSLAAVTK